MQSTITASAPSAAGKTRSAIRKLIARGNFIRDAIRTADRVKTPVRMLSKRWIKKNEARQTKNNRAKYGSVIQAGLFAAVFYVACEFSSPVLPAELRRAALPRRRGKTTKVRANF